MNLNLPETGFSCETVQYKEIDGIKLFIDVYRPDSKKTDMSMVLFFGGAWTTGDRKALSHFARVFSSKGMTVFCPDYRIYGIHKTTVFECIKDGRSAMRFVKSNSKRFGINPQRVGAGGGSAGGHVALCTHYIELDEAGDDISISPSPMFLTLFNPAVDTSYIPFPEIAKLFGGRGADASPYHHIKPGAPPTIIFHGDNDSTVPIKSVELFCNKSDEIGNSCRLVTYKGQEHAFFHHSKNPQIFFDVVSRMEKFIELIKQ